jgi:hypothetical protein
MKSYFISFIFVTQLKKFCKPNFTVAMCAGCSGVYIMPCVADPSFRCAHSG